MTKLEMGKTYYPPKQDVTITENLVRGDGWQVEKISGDFMFQFVSARHGGGVDKHNITADEFDKIKNRKMTFTDLLKKYDKI